MFLSRYHSPSTKGFSSHIKSILSDLDLPSVPELLEAFPTKIAWKALVKSIIYISFHEQFLEACSMLPSMSIIAELNPRLNGKPSSLITCFPNDNVLTRLNNFRLRLILNCAALNSDTAKFHPRLNRSRDPICSLCKGACEDTRHFVSVCPALQNIREAWLPPLVDRSDPSRDLISMIFGEIDPPLSHELVVRFLSALRTERLKLASVLNRPSLILY